MRWDRSTVHHNLAGAVRKELHAPCRSIGGSAMSKQQPEAMRLAEMLTADEWPGNVTLVSYARECVAELLRQHAENETLRVGYAAARLEIESLKAQLHAAKQINAAQFGLLAASIPGSALRASHGQAPAGAEQ